ncbi:MAG: ACP S-malonyltransferase [Rickettsiales bacterium]|jgi:[acyl-carrier-protein] S-malonyltransferase|nr:ACP S-malonyltransferase [Rickettsiales bacterium]
MKRGFIFPGQGSQSVGMSKEFYDNFVLAKQIFEEANDCLKKDLRKIMFEGPEDLLTQTENAQPAVATASVIVLKVLESELGKSVEGLCDFVAGHSVGEYSALCASGVFDFKTTLRLLEVRGKAFAEAGNINPGAMVAVLGATSEQIEELIARAKFDDEVLQVANDNTVGQVVLSGNQKSVFKVIEEAAAMNIKKAIRLPVSGAFHSELMFPAIDTMSNALEDVVPTSPKVKVIANYTAKCEEVGNIKENLIKQITGKVRWRETMLKMEQEGCEMFAEIGNGKVLSGMVMRTCPNVKAFTVNSIETLKEFIMNINN